MSDVTRILNAIEHGDPTAAGKLGPLVYDEWRKLARERMAQEKLGQTLQATALVHEAYVRLVDTDNVQNWNSRGHFFAAAAEAMRRILIENARWEVATAKELHAMPGPRDPIQSMAFTPDGTVFTTVAHDRTIRF